MLNPGYSVFNRRNLVVFLHKVTLGATGAIASQDAPNESGVVVTKTATKTGRYTLALPTGPTGFKYRKLLWVDAKIVGADDTAYTIAKGIDVLLRDNDIDGGALDGTIEVQFIRSDTDADAEVEDSRVLYFRVEVEM